MELRVRTSGENVTDGDRHHLFPEIRSFSRGCGVSENRCCGVGGTNVTDVLVGETVFATIGRVNGMHHWYAGHVSPSVCPRDQVWRLPGGVDPVAFAGMVLTQVGYNCGVRPDVKVGIARWSS